MNLHVNKKLPEVDINLRSWPLSQDTKGRLTNIEKLMYISMGGPLIDKVIKWLNSI